MSKQKRKQAAKRRKRDARAGVAAPRILDMLMDNMERWAPYLALSDTPDTVVALARERLAEAVEAIIAASESVDSFDVLEAVRIRLAPADPETFRESEHGATVSMIELTALILAARGTRVGTIPADGVKPGPETVLDILQAQLQDMMDAGSMLHMFSVDRDEPLHRVSFGTRLREMAVRNATYPHMLEDTLSALFDTVAMEDVCRSILGCTVGQIRAVFAAMQRLVVDSRNDRVNAMEELSRLAYLAGDDVSDLSSINIQRAGELLSRAAARPGANTTQTPEVIAVEAGLDVNTVATVLGLFSTPMQVRSPVEVALEFFEGKSPLRIRPLLATADDEYAIVHQALLVPAIRERVEEVLRADNVAWAAYSKHRGGYLETEAARLIAVHLPGCVQHLGFEYFVPVNDAEDAPSVYTKLVEGDGLLILDDVAIIIEAKAVALRPRSRTGDPLRLRQDLRRIVTDAADQGGRLRRRILEDQGLRLRDGTWLDLSNVREVHTIAVSLEDLSGIATITSELVVGGLLTTDNLPWTVSLHELRIISELVDRPAELLLYLRRRTAPDTTRRFHAVDELDFFLYFFASRFYVEPDPDVVYRELPQLGTPPTKNRRRFRQQGLELLASLTDPLDAWYLYRRGIRTTPADKPRMKANRELLLLIDELTGRGEPGWLAMTATLLNFDDTGQRRCAITGPRLAAETRADGLPHSLAMPAGTRRGDSVLLVWWTTEPTLSTEVSHRRLRDYATAKKHQLQLDRAIGFLYGYRAGELLATCYDNRIPGPDSSLDELCTHLRLKGPEAFQTAPPPRKRRRQ